MSVIDGALRYRGLGRYRVVAGYDSARPDRTDNTGHDRWDAAVGRTDAITGITMAAIRQFPGAEYSGFMGSYRTCAGLGQPGAARCWTGRT